MEYRAPSDITKSYGCNTALKSCSSHAGTMREPCGYHAGRHPHDTYSNDAQINVPAKKSLAVVNVAVSDRERRIASQAPMCTDSVELQCI